MVVSLSIAAVIGIIVNTTFRVIERRQRRSVQIELFSALILSPVIIASACPKGARAPALEKAAWVGPGNRGPHRPGCRLSARLSAHIGRLSARHGRFSPCGAEWGNDQAR